MTNTATNSPVPLLDPENIPIPRSEAGDAPVISPEVVAEKAAAYGVEYDQAAIALQHEQHQSMGLIDTIQTMFMWQESPAERVAKNRSGQSGSTP